MRRFMTVALATLVCVTGLYAQMPQFKSQEEIDAFMLVQGAVTPEQRAGAGVDFIAQFPKSEAVGLASYMVMLSYQQMNDFDNMLLYGEMVGQQSRGGSQDGHADLAGKRDTHADTRVRP
jgi:hypothetical protein